MGTVRGKQFLELPKRGSQAAGSVARLCGDSDQCYDFCTGQSPMSEEQLKAFLEKAKADASLQEKLKAAADSDAALSIANEAGFAITAEDIQSMKSSTDISDDELESAAGGGWWQSGPEHSCHITCL